jgi:hypothetical protein
MDKGDAQDLRHASPPRATQGEREGEHADVDRGLIREALTRSPEERLDRLSAQINAIEELRRGLKR